MTLQKNSAPSDVQFVRAVFRFDRLVSIAAVAFACVGAGGLVGTALGHGSRAIFSAAVVLLACALALAFLRRELRLRARDELLSWLPAGRGHLRSSKGPWGSDWDGLWGREEVATEDYSAGLTLARSEIRNATRALLASLQDEARREESRGRAERPACRRARLRTAGRPTTVRRRPSVRRTALPS